MNTSARMLVAVGLLSLAASATFADRWATPGSRIFASSKGEYGFKVMPPAANAPRAHEPRGGGTLFSLDEWGNEKPIWNVRLVNIPVRALVSDDGKYVVTLDTWGGAGFDHSLVVYGAKGKVVADFKLEELLTPAEIKKHTAPTQTSRRWTHQARFEFDPLKEQLTLDFKWGKVIRVSLETGKIEK